MAKITLTAGQVERLVGTSPHESTTGKVHIELTDQQVYDVRCDTRDLRIAGPWEETRPTPSPYTRRDRWVRRYANGEEVVSVEERVGLGWYDDAGDLLAGVETREQAMAFKDGRLRARGVVLLPLRPVLPSRA